MQTAFLAQKLLSRARKKFFLFSAVGACVAIAAAAWAHMAHQRAVLQQQKIFRLYDTINDQRLLINEVALEIKSIDLNRGRMVPENRDRVQTLLNRLNTMNAKVAERIRSEGWGDKVIRKSVDDSTPFILPVARFIKDISELLERRWITQGQLDQSLLPLISSQRESAKESLKELASSLERYQAQSLDRLKTTTNWILIAILIVMLAIWFLVFRPLYSISKSLHEKVVAEVVKAESANRSKTEFLANISHEIRTPMTAICGYAEVLRSPDLREDQRLSAVNIILQNGDHLLSLIEEILDVSKIEDGKLQVIDEPFNLVGTLSTFYSLINVKAAAKGIDLVLEADGRIPTDIISDQKRIKQVLFNLVGNAIKFTDSGYVKLSVSAKINKQGESAALAFRVKDTGCGIPKRAVSRLFRPFEQVNTTAAREHGGTGLGLVLSQRIAKLLGGNVQLARTEPGVGSEFVATMNVKIADNSQMTASLSTNIALANNTEKASISLKGIKVMVVDDAKENARLFSTYLDSAGAEVVTQINADDAIDTLKHDADDSVDVVLMDLQMPKKDGYQALKEIQKLKPQLPVLALTAHAMEEEKERTRIAGFKAHLVKPIEARKLIEAVFVASSGTPAELA